jgi:hypothetical protein
VDVLRILDTRPCIGNDVTVITMQDVTTKYTGKPMHHQPSNAYCQLADIYVLVRNSHGARCRKHQATTTHLVLEKLYRKIIANDCKEHQICDCTQYTFDARSRKGPPPRAYSYPALMKIKIRF